MQMLDAFHLYHHAIRDYEIGAMRRQEVSLIEERNPWLSLKRDIALREFYAQCTLVD